MGTLSIFVFGVVAGVGLTIVAAFYLLTEVDTNEKDEKCLDDTKHVLDLREGESTEEDRKLLSDALKKLEGDPTTKTDESHPSEERAPLGDPQHVEKLLFDCSREAKERQKHIRSLCSFFTEYAKVAKGYAKDLSKLSTTAETYVKAQNDKYMDKWWNSLSIAMDHLSQDQAYLSDYIDHDICFNLNRIFEEHTHLEKQLNNEGTKHTQKFKDAKLAVDARARDRDRIREKLSTSLERSAQAHANTLSLDSTKLSQKLTVCDALLQDAVR